MGGLFRKLIEVSQKKFRKLLSGHFNPSPSIVRQSDAGRLLYHFRLKKQTNLSWRVCDMKVGFEI